MTIFDKVRKSFANCEIGEVFTTQEIISKVHTDFGVNPDSIIPSDYCYNITNNGIYNYENYLHIFEQIQRGKYKYLGENYTYTGKVYNKGTPVGEWINGKYYAFTRDSLRQDQYDKFFNTAQDNKHILNIKENYYKNVDQRIEFLRISHVHGKTVEEAIRNSVKRAYRDFCRTLRGFGSVKNNTVVKDKAENLLCSELRIFLTVGTSHFNEWHKNLMQKLIESFQDQRLTLGQAQKWINMSFKYLYCFTAYNLHGISKRQFEQCHTPIDNYVLNNAFKWYGIRPLPIAWSKLNDYDLYINYQMDLKLVADNKGITQLELDFELWQRNGEVILK